MNLIKIVIIIFLLILLCACNSEKYTKKPYIITIKKEIINDGETYYGKIKAENFPTLSFQSEGQIVYFPYSKGDFVKKGKTIAKLDNELYAIQKKQEETTLNEAQIQYTKSKSYYARMDKLHKAGGISDNDWEDAYFQLKTNAQKINIQKQKINYINRQIRYNSLIAPFDGYIEDKYAELGSYVSIGSPVVSFLMAKTKVEVVVDSLSINDVKNNTPVEVSRNNETFQGKITHISKTSDNLGGYLVTIELNSPNIKLLDGQSVTIKFEQDKKEAIYISKYAIFEQDGQSYVYKIAGNNKNARIEKQKVEIRNVSYDKVEITQGLNEDDRIIASDIQDYKEGEKLEL